MKKLSVILICLILITFSVPSFSALKVQRLRFNNPDFIKGMDISSVIALENSGVKYYDLSGKESDIFKILSENGVNCIRVRVWNNPFDKDKNGYGGGNCGVETACEIGRRAAKYNMKLLVDFHYSDFWADPGKQKAPKEWENLTLNEKCNKLSLFTAESLSEIKSAGADITMVQIGNETNSGIAGEYTNENMARIFKSASNAVREFDSNIKIAVHFTNPENTETMRYFADFLNEYNIDYDVFATSYYPYWHGSLTNLTSVLDYAAEKYGKYTMVAETSYANTLKDTDGHLNTVSENSNNSGENLLWDFTAQGQADEFRAVAQAVNNVKNGKGLGVFYWEGAWITVGDVSGLSSEEYSDRLEKNKTLWEKYGSGWASVFSGEYDPDDAGKWYGGSAVDNQAFFGSNGRALSSIKVFRYIDKDMILGDSDDSEAVNIRDATFIQKHLVLLKDVNETAADVDGDGVVTVKDASAIQRYIAKIKTDYPINEVIN